MTYSNKPLEEKMTLFWHGHFANSDQKIRDPLAMYRQNQLFRVNALGNFESLLLGVCKASASTVGSRQAQSCMSDNLCHFL
jgi:uncharacterized protein (DUF1800 family)